jgi:hypothetical protein
MKAVLTRVQRLERRFAPSFARDFVQNPRARMRCIVSTIGHSLNLANSSCTRSLTKDGCLTEVVDLDGASDDISDKELERFIESFPVDTSRLEVQR